MNLPSKALTVHDPWAQAIVHGTKWIENRTWKPYSGSLGNRLFIHTAKAWNDDHETTANSLRFMKLHDYDDELAAHGAIIGSVRVVGWVRDEAAESEYEFDCGWTREPLRHKNRATVSPWWQGPVGWVLTDAVPYETPIFTRGQQRIWTPPERVQKLCWEQERTYREDHG